MRRHITTNQPIPLPAWLSATEQSETPFNIQRSPGITRTRDVLAKRIQSEPRLLKAIEFLQENIAPGSKEWGLVQKFCRDASRQLLESHEYFVNSNHCDIERNLLILGAYAQDNSFSPFFQHHRQMLTDEHNLLHIDSTEKMKYAEAIHAVLPIVAAIQPRVAVAFADSIYRSQLYIGDSAAVEATYEDIARNHPSLILNARIEKRPKSNEESQGLFGIFPNRDRIFAIAQDAYKNHAPATPLEESWAATIDGQNRLVSDVTFETPSAYR